MRIDVEGVSWGPTPVDVVHDVRVSIGHGRTVGVVGPNGSGKSSLLRLLAGLRRPRVGVVSYDGADALRMPARARAQRVAFLDQTAATAVDFTIEDVVGLGRLPHRGLHSRRGSGLREARAEDRDAIEEALDWTGLSGLRATPWSAISGGEQQRAHLARAIAQRAECLILDEPTNHLDVEHQLDILQLVCGREGVTNVIALHDLELASRYCDELVVLQDGRVQTQGPPADVLTESLVRRVFHVRLDHTAAASGATSLMLTRLPSTVQYPSAQ